MRKSLLKLKYTWYLFIFKYLGILLPRYASKVAYNVFTKPSRHLPKLVDNKLLENAIVIEEKYQSKKLIGYKFGNSDNLILLVHGWSSHALVFRKFIPKLLAAGYSVLAFDAPGHGKSEGKYLNALLYVEVLKYIMNKYQPYGIIAHSMGGICSLFAMLNCSLTDRIIKKVVIASSMDAEYFISQFIRKAHLHKKVEREFRGDILKLADNDPKRFSIQLSYPDGLHFDGLIVHDIYDTTIPYKEGQKLAKIWPKAAVYKTEHLGHLNILKNLDVVNHIIDYIKE